jgi:single-strand DNA-binding protein
MSLGLNLEIMAGRVVKDPKVIKTRSGNEMAIFTLAVNEKLGSKDTTEYVDCAAFNGLVKVFKEYVNKPDYILVQGRRNTTKKEKNGVTYTNVGLTVNRFAFAGSGFALTVIQGRATTGGKLTWIDSKFTENGKLAIYKVTVAVNKKIGDKQETVFYNVEFKGKYAEVLSSLVKKGKPVIVTGEELFTSKEREVGDGYDRYQKLRGWDLKLVPEDHKDGAPKSATKSATKSEAAQKAAEETQDFDLENDLDIDLRGELDGFGDLEDEFAEFDDLNV